MERDKDHRNRSRSTPGSGAYTGGDTAKNVGIELYGVPEREKQHNAVLAIRRVEIQVSKQRILV